MANKRLKRHLAGNEVGVSKKRRALVKGSAVAAPAIFSLRSGAALAATSTSQCAANDQLRAQREEPDPLPSKGSFSNFTGDPWVRTRVPCRFIQNTGGTDEQKLDAFWVFQHPFDNTVWFNEAENTSSGVAYRDSGTDKMAGGGQAYDVITNDPAIQADVIAIFDQNLKQIVAYGTDAERRNITHSCYASIMNAP